jgi:hypothetical protein
MRAASLAVPLLIAAAPAAAQAMTVAELMTTAAALKAKGAGAMFSPDLRRVVGAFRTAGTDYRADLERARAAGRTDLGCPPPKGKVKLKPADVMADFAAIPPAQARTTSVKTAFYAMMAKRFPCG